MNPIITRQRTRPQTVAGVAAAGSLLTVLGTLLPWASATVLISVSVRGVRTDEGEVALALAAVGALTAMVALLARDGRALFATAMAGLGALIAETVFAFRLADSFSDAVALDPGDGALTLELGWMIALLGSLLMLGSGLWASRKHR
jgi:hypothetical protein